MVERNGLVGRTVTVKYQRVQQYPPGSMAKVLGWFGGTAEQLEIMYLLEFPDGTTVYAVKDEFTVS